MGIFSAMNVGCDGLRVHGTRLDINSRNIANIDTPNYVRKIPVINATEDISFSGLLNNMKEDVFATGTIPFLSGGVHFDGTIEDPTPGEKMYKPGHPDADENGFVTASNVNPLVDMADAMLAQRAYQASLGVMMISKTMANRALDIGGNG